MSVGTSGSNSQFGVLTFSGHRPDRDATLQLERDLELAEYAEQVGFDQCWWAEQHGGGAQLVSDPLQLVAQAAARTSRIALGALSSLELHQPKVLLDSAIQLSHLTRGRFNWAVGSLTSAHEHAALGMSEASSRRLFAQSLESIVALLRNKSAVTSDSGGREWALHQARLGVGAYAGLPVKVAAFGSPDAVDLAARTGLDMLTFASTIRSGMADRRNWSVLLPLHLAATQEQARQQVREQIVGYFDAIAHVLPFPLPDRRDPDTLIDAIHAAGHGVIGTPQMALERLEQIRRVSGGVGIYLIEAGAWASTSDSHSSLRLFAEQVMPRMRGAHQIRLAATERAHATKPNELATPPRPVPAAPAQPQAPSPAPANARHRTPAPTRAQAPTRAPQAPTRAQPSARAPQAPTRAQAPSRAQPSARPQPAATPRTQPIPVGPAQSTPTPALHHSSNGSSRLYRSSGTRPAPKPEDPAEAGLSIFDQLTNDLIDRQRGRHTMGDDEGRRI
ncbi:MAG: LLM class flavin-dependent oxidoreductase [Beutenbergiaceae bacterium]